MNIRLYTDKDYEMLAEWWKSIDLTLDKDMIPETTFILEIDGVPRYSACLYLMNCKAGCMVENVIKNPSYKHKSSGLKILMTEMEKISKELGYTKMIIFSYEDKVKNLYETLGFHKTLNNVTTFCKELE